MRPFGLVFLLLAACDREPARAPSTTVTTSTVSTTTAPRAAGGGPRNLAMGTGEPRLPEAFTLEQRLRAAVEQGDRATIERALERGADLHSRDEIGRTVVVLAVKYAGDLELARWLHAKGAAVDVPDAGGRTALSFAAEDGRLDAVRWLVEEGALVDRRDVQRRTPLFHAALGGHPEVVRWLHGRGAAVDARDQFGDTPLMVACAKGHDATAAALLELGADPSLRDQEGRTARDRAAPGTERCLGLPS
jgi:ankyrin repeat protein